MAVLSDDEQGVALEGVEVVADRSNHIGLAERGTQVLDDVPALTLSGARDFVDGVVLVAQVGAVEQHHRDDQASVRLGADAN